ncbi:DUF4817 domain-containing protein [Trichonephila clavipes]|nr:DUF4817 domain-containing protein [Trichonephila clavipes]
MISFTLKKSNTIRRSSYRSCFESPRQSRWISEDAWQAKHLKQVGKTLFPSLKIKVRVWSLRKSRNDLFLPAPLKENDEAHFWLNGYVNKQNCRIWTEANPQVYVEIPLHPEKLTVWCALWAGGILLQKR